MQAEFSSFRPDPQMANDSRRFQEIWKQSGLIKRIGIVAGCLVVSPIAIGYLATAKGIPALAQLTAQHLVQPAFRVLFQTLPIVIRDYALLPLLHGGKALVTASINHLFAPTARLIGQLGHQILHRAIIPTGKALLTAGRVVTNRLFMPILEVVDRILEIMLINIPKGFYTHVLKPMGGAIRTVAQLTYRHLLAPMGRTALRTARLFFVEIPRVLWKDVIVPSARLLGRATTFVVDRILTPIVRTVVRIAKILLIDIPKAIYEHVFLPIGRFLKRVTDITCEYLLFPAARAVTHVAKAVFVTFPKICYERALVPMGRLIGHTATAIHKHTIKPAIRRTSAIASILLVTLPLALYRHALAPAGRLLVNGTTAIVRLGFTYLMAPTARAIGLVARTLLVDAPKAAGTFAWDQIQWVVREVGVPIQKSVVSFFNEVIPAAYRSVRDYLAGEKKKAAQSP